MSFQGKVRQKLGVNLSGGMPSGTMLVGDADGIGQAVTPSGAITVSNTGVTTLDPTLVQYREVTLTSAQVKALRATPIDLVPAPGAGKFLEFLGAVLKLDYGSNAFTETTDNLVIQYDGGQDASAAIEMTGFIDQTADMIAKVIPATIAAVAAANVENDALELFNTGDGEIAGNAANDSTLVVGISYRTHTL